MIVLDTNVLSALMLKVPNHSVVSWLDGQPSESIWTTSISVFGIQFGLAILDDGRNKARRPENFILDRPDLPRSSHNTSP